MKRKLYVLLVAVSIVTSAGRSTTAYAANPVKCLIITGDHGHDWKSTTPVIKAFLSEGGRIQVNVTETPTKDLTRTNLARYDVLLLHYQDRVLSRSVVSGSPLTRFLRSASNEVPNGSSPKTHIWRLVPKSIFFGHSINLATWKMRAALMSYSRKVSAAEIFPTVKDGIIEKTQAIATNSRRKLYLTNSRWVFCFSFTNVIPLKSAVRFVYMAGAGGLSPNIT